MTRDEQILSVDRLCYKLARNYCDKNNFDDLLQEARLGVCECVKNYDESRNIKFITYAKHYAEGYIKKYFERKSRLIKTPKDIKEHKQIVEFEYLENFGIDDVYNEIDLSFLKPREQYVIKRYFYDRYTFDDIAEEAGFGCSYWYKVKKEALAKLKLKLSN